MSARGSRLKALMFWMSYKVYNFASAVFAPTFEALMKQIGYTCIIQSIVHRWPLLSPIFRAVYKSRVENIVHLLKRSKNRSILELLHEIGSVGQPGHAPLIETGGSQRE